MKAQWYKSHRGHKGLQKIFSIFFDFNFFFNAIAVSISLLCILNLLVFYTAVFFASFTPFFLSTYLCCVVYFHFWYQRWLLEFLFTHLHFIFVFVDEKIIPFYPLSAEMRSKGYEIFNFRLTYGINVSLRPVFCLKKKKTEIEMKTEKTKDQSKNAREKLQFSCTFSADQSCDLSVR